MGNLGRKQELQVARNDFFDLKFGCCYMNAVLSANSMAVIASSRTRTRHTHSYMGRLQSGPDTRTLGTLGRVDLRGPAVPSSSVDVGVVTMTEAFAAHGWFF